MFAMVEGEALAAELVDEVLHVATLKFRQLPAAERWDHIRVEELLVAAGGRRLVGLASSVEDRPVVGAFDEDVSGLGDRLRCWRANRAATERDLSVLPPQLRGADRREGPPHLAAGPRVVGLGLIARCAVAPATVARLAVASVTSADTGGHEGD